MKPMNHRMCNDPFGDETNAEASLDQTSPAAAAPSSEAVRSQTLAQLPPEGLNLKDYIETIERALLVQALAQTGGVITHAARLLNIRRTTLVEKLRKYGLNRESRLELDKAPD